MILAFVGTPMPDYSPDWEGFISAWKTPVALQCPICKRVEFSVYNIKVEKGYRHSADVFAVVYKELTNKLLNPPDAHSIEAFLDDVDTTCSWCSKHPQNSLEYVADILPENK